MHKEKISHSYLLGVSLVTCHFCNYGRCFSGVTIATDCDCTTACAIALLPHYQRSADKRRRAPFFAIRGSLKIRGRILNKIDKPCRNLLVRLNFPNGLSTTTRTDAQGKFNLQIESSSERPTRVINMGSFNYLEHGRRCFDLGFIFKKS